jgi:hypothetical protein
MEEQYKLVHLRPRRMCSHHLAVCGGRTFHPISLVKDKGFQHSKPTVPLGNKVYALRCLLHCLPAVAQDAALQ